MTELGWLDTNLFVHSLFPSDPHATRCAGILRALQDRRATGRLSALVVHELSYVLLRLPAFHSRSEVHRYIRAIVLSDGIQVDEKRLVLEALSRWADSTIGFVDAWLSVVAVRSDGRVCSVNERDFSGLTNTYREAAI